MLQGERLQYVLLAGEQKQDDAAEDPLTAARAGQEGDYSLYWKVLPWGNKRVSLVLVLPVLYACCRCAELLCAYMQGLPA